MIREFEFYHGIVFARLLHATKAEISVQSFPTSDNASYVINGKVGVYIKYSSKRLSPWRFSFQKRHQEEILEMKNKLGEVFVLLVCNDDGVVGLNFSEIREILDEVHKEAEWIRIVRTRRQMYAVQGSDGKLEHKSGKDDFPQRILKACNSMATEVPVLSWFHAEEVN
jgi:hypothetical protein